MDTVIGKELQRGLSSEKCKVRSLGCLFFKVTYIHTGIIIHMQYMQLHIHTYIKAFTCSEKFWKDTEDTDCLWEAGLEVGD